MKKTIVCLLLWLSFCEIGTRNSYSIDPLDMDAPYQALGTGRSDEWPSFRRKFIKAHPRCEACGTNRLLNAHHIIPFYMNKKLELIEDNLIVLCRKHHLQVGHLGDWKRFNPNVREDTAKMLSKKGIEP